MILRTIQPRQSQGTRPIVGFTTPVTATVRFLRFLRFQVTSSRPPTSTPVKLSFSTRTKLSFSKVRRFKLFYANSIFLLLSGFFFRSLRGKNGAFSSFIPNFQDPSYIIYLLKFCSCFDCTSNDGFI